MHNYDCNVDRFGNQFGKDYSLILTDPSFERRLRSFDSNLKLMFDQNKKRWVVLEWAPDGSGWNRILLCEDDFGNPQPVGDWIFGILRDYREQYDLKHKNFNAWWLGLEYQRNQNEINADSSWAKSSREYVKDDMISWKKAYRELNNLPSSDVTAGYRKVI